MNICESVEGDVHDQGDKNDDGPENDDKNAVAAHDQRQTAGTPVKVSKERLSSWFLKCISLYKPTRDCEPI